MALPLNYCVLAIFQVETIDNPLLEGSAKRLVAVYRVPMEAAEKMCSIPAR